MTCILLYLACVWSVDISFDIFVISFLTNICLLPIILRKNTARRVEDPIEYVNVCEDNLYVGDLKVPISNIKKVAIDSVGADGYFSLPYNHIAPVGVPNFSFPAQRIPAFKKYLIECIGDVEFVK